MEHQLKHARIAEITDGSGATDVCILINGIPHLKFIKEKYISLQAWYVSNVDFKIEIYLKDATMKLEYNSIEKWKSVLQIINSQI